MKKVERPYIPERGKTDVSHHITFQPYPYDTDTVEHLLTSIPRALTPKFLSAEWKRRPRRHRLSGMCVVASQAFYHLLDTDRLVVKSTVDPYGDNHFWLEDNGVVMDPTGGQYQGFPYDQGKVKNWYGYKGRIQVRSLLLMEKVLRFDERTIEDSRLPAKSW